MILQGLSIVNYRNIAGVELRFSPKINCFVGRNGSGKTNVLDAVYYLSFCRSAINPIDSQVLMHGQEFFVLNGQYLSESGEQLSVYCGMKRGVRKRMKRNQKDYKKLSEHIGVVPLVMVAPSDSFLIEGGSEERRKLMDMVISQYDHGYMDSLARYGRALQQRNSLLKQEDEPDSSLMDILEEQMAFEGERIFAKRADFVEKLIPVFQKYYTAISEGREQIGLTYLSHCQRGELLDVIRRDRAKDRVVGYSLHGVHRDDLEFTIGGHALRREGSQGQAKTFVVALKFAQFEFLKLASGGNVPLLLLDDIFDKLDAGRVKQIVGLVSSEDFGQIFITDTNREHLDQILGASSHDFMMFDVENGVIKEGVCSREK